MNIKINNYSSGMFFKFLMRYPKKNVIMLTQLCNLDPLEVPFNTLKLGFTGIYIIFLVYKKTKIVNSVMQEHEYNGTFITFSVATCYIFCDSVIIAYLRY